MSALLEEYRSRLRVAMAKLGELSSELDAEQRAKVEPIAILGMGCRFPPHASTPEAFFRSLEEGVDGISEVPPERWRLDPPGGSAADPERRAARWGGFLKDVDQFDAFFFGLSPREVTSLDPQQRLLIEVTWEALERAGQVPERLSGGRVGVFVGMTTNDYAALSLAADPDAGDIYTATGNGHCFSAGRLSYTFGFQGPSMAVDTACSSSLVAVHLACQSLRGGESTLAIAGGVNLMLSPTAALLLARTQALSPDGRCKAFDAGADGFVRGEGCGVVVLKRLSDAQRDGDPILAVLRGSVVNQDGRSTGLTAPNVLSQQAMLRRALESARASAEDIGYVETHGTGTSLGDPIELEALKAVLGKPRGDGSPCVLGAVKTNVGHLEAAAGMAGLLKAVLCLQREVIPPNLHWKALNPRISLEGTPFVLPTKALPWKAGEKPRLAGVSAFGMSGTNAHVVLEEAPREEATAGAAEEASSYVLPLSAKSPEALLALVRGYQEVLTADPSAESAARLHDIAYTASLRRSQHEHRLAVVGRSREEMAAALAACSGGELQAGVVQGKAPLGPRPKVVFVYPGQGSQWVGMGRELFVEEPVFRDAIEACDALVKRHGGFSLREALDAPEGTSRLHETEVAQPALFAIQVALSALWKSWGVTPDAVVGHSVGEVAAAHVAGALSLEDAVRLVCLRGRVMQQATGLGKMASVSLSAEEATRALEGYEDRLAVAAINDPGSVVLSGEAAALEEVVARLSQRSVHCRMLRVNYAFHSPQMAPFQRELERALGRIAPPQAALAIMYSTVTGARVEGKELDASYWARNIREPVQLAGAASAAIAAGHRIFLEVGPHPVLSANLQQCLAAWNHEGHAIPTLRRGQEERQSLLRSLGALYAHGYAVAFERLYPSRGRVVSLPTYPWQRQRYWVGSSGAKPREAQGGSGAPSSALLALLDAEDGAAFAAHLGPPGAFSPEELPAVTRVLEALRAKEREARLDLRIQDWIYTQAWRSLPLPPSSTPTASGHWVVLVDDGGLGDRVADALEAAGGTCSRLRLGAALDPTSAADLGAWWSARCAERGPARGVLHLWSLGDALQEEGGLDAVLQRSVYSALALVQALAETGQGRPPKLWLVSRGAVSVGDSDPVTAPEQAPLWGLGRVVALEHPELWGGLIDLDPESAPEQEAARLCEELVQSDGEDQIALRAGQRYGARLVRGAAAAVTTGAVTLDPAATYLITSGLDAAELGVARWMVERGARHVYLVGPREAPEAAEDVLRELAAAGAEVSVVRADVADDAALGRVLEPIAASGWPLRGVVHAAGVPDDGVLLHQSAERFAKGVAPKAAGAWNLHRRTRALKLDFFVLFSSAASLLGSAGQGSYAATNAFLDALAHRRRAEGLPALSIQWAAEAAAGRASTPGQERLRQAPRGRGAIQPAEARRCLERLIGGGAVQAAVLNIDWSQHLDLSSGGAVPPLLAELAREACPEETSAPEAKGPPPLVLRLEQAAKGARRAILADHVQREVDRVLGMDPSRKAPPQLGFFDMGMDSLMAVELKNRLQRSLGRSLLSTLVFNYPTIEAVTAYLAGEVLSEGAPQAPARPLPERATLIDEVAQLSEEEMATLIDRELSSLLPA